MTDNLKAEALAKQCHPIFAGQDPTIVAAFLSIDGEGHNGVVASILPGLGSTPLVTSKRSVAKTLIPIAQEVATKTGVDVGLYTFARVEGEELWRSE